MIILKVENPKFDPVYLPEKVLEYQTSDKEKSRKMHHSFDITQMKKMVYQKISWNHQAFRGINVRIRPSILSILQSGKSRFRQNCLNHDTQDSRIDRIMPPYDQKPDHSPS